MNNKIIFVAAAAALLALNFAGCKDDDKPSTIPTQPTTMSIENGAEISETKVSLSVSGSTVEDQECNISYDYYIGTSQDNLVKTTPQDINLTPYTQYFWYAKAKTETDESEPTEIRTFYCVPPFEIETDNGDGEWAAVLRFKGLPSHKGGKVTLTPDKKGYNYQKEIEIPEGQDFCSIKMGNANNPTNAAYTHWWDDEHGIYYEPIIYDFKAVVNVQVGDKTISISNNAKEIILDKQSCVRDHEYNVYRIAKIGNKTWLTDDLRSTSILYNGEVISLDIFQYSYEVSHYEGGIIVKRDTLTRKLYDSTRTLESGAKGVRYFTGDEFIRLTSDNCKDVRFKGVKNTQDIMKYALPTGFRFPTVADWFDLLKSYEVDEPFIFNEPILEDGKTSTATPLCYCDEDELKNPYMQKRIQNAFCGAAEFVRGEMSSMYDWKFFDASETSNKVFKPFNSKPFAGNGFGSCYLSELPNGYPGGVYFILSSINSGAAVVGYRNETSIALLYVSIRAVKDVE